MRRFIILYILFPFWLSSQVPVGMNYQGVVRGDDNVPLTSQQVGIRFSILEGAENGEAVFIESHDALANQFGLVNLVIGTGSPELGDLATINWFTGDYYLKIELDPAGGDDYVLMGTNRLLSVPFAFHAETVSHPEDADADPQNESISDLSLEDDVLVIYEGENTFNIDLAQYHQVLSKEGNQIILSNGGGTVTDATQDADADPSNELQDLTLEGLTLGITGGNSVNLSAFSHWTGFANGIFYNAGEVRIGNPGVLPALFLDHQSVNVLGSTRKSILVPDGISFFDNAQLRTVLDQDGIRIFNASGAPEILLEKNVSGAGALDLFNANGGLNARLGNSMGSNLTGQLDLNFNGNPRIKLAATAQDASLIYSYGPNGIINTFIGYESIDPAAGLFEVNQFGTVRARIRSTLDDAGSLTLHGPDQEMENIVLANRPGYPHSGYLSILHEGKEFAEFKALANASGSLSILNPGTTENLKFYATDTLPSFGRISFYGEDMEQLDLHASPLGAGVIRSIGPAGFSNIELGGNVFNPDAGALHLYADGSEIIRIGADTTEMQPGQILLLGPDEHKILEIKSEEDKPDVGGMVFYGADEIENVRIGSTSNPRTGSITTYTFGKPVNRIEVNQSQSGTISTWHKDGQLKTSLSTSSLYEAGTFTTYLGNLPLVELTTSEYGSGYFRSFLNQVPTIQMTTNSAGTGSIWLSNLSGQTEVILGSDENAGGGLLSLNYLGLPRMRSFSGPGIPGIMETFTDDGDLSIKLGYMQDHPATGTIETRTQGMLRNLLSNNNDASAGYMATFGENGNINCTIGNLNAKPNNGYIGVSNSTGNTLAGMFVNVNNEGVLFGSLTSFRIDHPEEEDQEIWYAGLEGPEAAAYVRGTATLVKGRCTVEFPDHFLHVADPASMTVLMTPLSADSKGLAVVHKSDTGFIVKELFNGEGDYTFDWEVKCVRKGYEDFRVLRSKEEIQAGLPSASMTEKSGGIPSASDEVNMPEGAKGNDK